MSFLRNAVLMAALVAAIQIGFLSWSIIGRAAILRDGREVLLKVEPIDPRDLLRGDYVRLGYPAINQLPISIFTNPPADTYMAANETIFVRLEKRPDGYWEPVSASIGAPTTPAGAEQVDLRGQLAGYESVDANNQRLLSADFGIERYYVPEGEGRAIETNMAVRPFGIRLAVASNGAPQIKALMDGDVQLYAEPLY